jgi:hypothetical protein
LTGAGWNNITTLTFTRTAGSGASPDIDNLAYTVNATGGDTTPPNAVCMNATIQLDAAGNASVTAAQVDGGSTDDTGITMRSVSPNTFTCANVGSNTVTLTVQDAAGNMDTCTAIVTVQDNINPTITCAAGGTRNPQPGQMTYTVQGNEFNPTASGDNCGTPTLTHNFNGGGNSLAGEMLPLGDTTITWTADDGNGQTTTCMLTVTVEYDADPTIMGDANNNDFEVFVDGTEIVVTQDGTEVVRQPISVTNSITIDGGDGNDNFEADFSGGNFTIPINFNGQGETGAPGDSLSITGGTFTSAEVNHSPAGPNGNNGNLNFDGSTITYTGLEPIDMTGSTITDLVINLPNVVANNATLQDNAAVGASELIDNGATFEDTAFANPSNSLTINTGDQGDVINVQGLDAAYDANLTINAATTGDTVNFDTLPTSIDSGNLLVNADVLSVDTTFNTSGGISINSNNNSTITSGGTLLTSGASDIIINAGIAPTPGSAFIGLNNSGTIQATGTGNITIVADAAGTTGSFRTGVLVNTAATIESVSGAISITGTGADAVNSNHGITFFPNSTVASIAAGGITLNGTAGNGAGITNFGIAGNQVTIQDTNGVISITGIGSGNGQGGVGVRFISGSQIESTTNDVLINGTGAATGTVDNFGVEINASTISGGNNLTINGTPGNATDTAMTFIGSMNDVSASNILTLNAVSGEINTPNGIQTNDLFTGNVVVDGILAPGQSPGQLLVAGAFTIGAGDTLEIEVDEFDTAGTDYDQVVVTGTVDITGATLTLVDNTAAIGEIGDVITIIDNDGADSIVGTFAGIADGDDVAFNGETWRLFYNGGDGNDVLLAFVPDPLADVYVNDDFTAADGTFIADADPNTAGTQAAVIGVNAYDTIQEGVDEVDTAGNVNITDDLGTDGAECMLKM